MIMQFQRFGKILATRPLGRQVRSEIINELRKNDVIIFDLEGVDTVSNSFADECFAKLLSEMDLSTLKRRTTFRNASPFIKGVITYAIKEGLASQSEHSSYKAAA
ncbi:STAS-like domain-containing protein [Larkinella insperata]|uniref:STAS-like domain-containing protein n=1 Tax=Larkinella insperata TaxID=332158 RepID=A0ABW3QG91_9BACT|nr:STAS-like domain-containing protein [Larkinella insperata]